MNKVLMLLLLSAPLLATQNEIYNVHTDTLTVRSRIIFGDNTVQTTAASTSSGPVVMARVALTNQGANISATVLTTATVTGVYQISMYIVTTVTSLGAGTAVLPGFDYTDDFQDQTVTAPTFDMTGSTTGTSTLTTAVEALANTPITYSVFTGHSYSTAKYSLYITVLKL